MQILPAARLRPLFGSIGRTVGRAFWAYGVLGLCSAEVDLRQTTRSVWVMFLTFRLEKRVQWPHAV